MKHPYSFKIFGLAALLACHPPAATAFEQPVKPVETADVLAPEQRPRVVVVKPVVLCDDDGSHPARTAFPKKQVDQVYSRAGLEFIYLEPVFWNNGPARRGEIDPAEIVKQGRATGHISMDRHIVTMVFASAVDKEAKLMGRGMQNENVCIISLGNDPAMDAPSKQAYVVAHELGHCLGLRHAADDQAVPDDVPNLQGDGPLDQRLAVAGLHPSQCATVLESPLVVDRVKCYSAEESRKALTDESWYPYLTDATDDVLRFALGMPDNGPIPREKSARLEFARKHHAEMAADFTALEQAALRRLVAKLDRKLDGAWPMLTRLPWHFVKVKSGFCSNLPHTRGIFTVFSADAMKRLLSSEDAAMDILLHEKIHVVQRLNPDRFTGLYRKFGYVPLRLAAGEAERLNLIQNPDAPVNDWAVALPGESVIIATAFTKTPDQALGFAETYYHLDPLPDGTSRVGGKLADPSSADAWRKRFPIRISYDHPHEVFAYMSGEIFALREHRQALRDYRQGPRDNELMDLTIKTLPQIFALAGD